MYGSETKLIKFVPKLSLVIQKSQVSVFHGTTQNSSIKKKNSNRLNMKLNIIGKVEIRGREGSGRGERDWGVRVDESELMR